MKEMKENKVSGFLPRFAVDYAALILDAIKRKQNSQKYQTGIDFRGLYKSSKSLLRHSVSPISLVTVLVCFYRGLLATPVLSMSPFANGLAANSRIFYLLETDV